MRKIISFFLILTGCVILKNSQHNQIITGINYVDVLSGKKKKYWDLQSERKNTGSGWIFYSDTTFKKFYYNYQNKRIFLPNTSLEEDIFKFELIKDTLVLHLYNNYRFKILEINEDSLVLKNLDDFIYTYMPDTIIYLKSKDQQTTPVWEYFLPPDPKEWPIRHILIENKDSLP